MTTATGHVLDDALKDGRAYMNPYKIDTIKIMGSMLLSAHDAIEISSSAAKLNHQFARIDLATIIGKCADYYEQNSGGTFE